LSYYKNDKINNLNYIQNNVEIDFDHMQDFIFGQKIEGIEAKSKLLLE
jgi:hypothetical protein